MARLRSGPVKYLLQLVNNEHAADQNRQPWPQVCTKMQQKVSGMQQINGEEQLAPDIKNIHSSGKLNNYDLNNNKQMNLCNSASKADKWTAAYTGTDGNVDWLLSDAQQLMTKQWTELSHKVWTFIAVGSQDLHTVRTITPSQHLYQFISIQYSQ